jgi:hypothetical protein
MLLSKGPEKFRPAIAFLLSSNTDQVVVATRLGPDGKPDVNSAVPLPAEKAIIASDDDERSMVSFEDISHVITAIKNTDMMGRFDQQTIIYGLLILAQELCVKVDPRVAIGIQGVLAMCKEPVDGIYVEGADGPIKH